MKPATLRDRAVELIAPDAADREQCIRDVIEALTVIETSRRDLPALLRQRSKHGKKAARCLSRELDRLRVALSDKDLPYDLRIMFPIGRYRGTAEQTKQPFEGLIALAFDTTEPNDWLPQWQKRAQHFGDSKTIIKTMQVRTQLRLDACSQAYDLLEKRGRKIVATRDGEFCQLAAILLGEPKANLERSCSETISLKKSPFLKRFP